MVCQKYWAVLTAVLPGRRAWPLKSLALGYPCAYQFSLNCFKRMREGPGEVLASPHSPSPPEQHFLHGRDLRDLRCCQDHHGHQPSGVGVTFLSPLKSRLLVWVSIWSALKWHQNFNFSFSFTLILKNQHKKGICGMVLASSTLNFTASI